VNPVLTADDGEMALSRRRRACRHSPIAVPSAMIKISYSGYRFPPEIIQHAIWLYIRFALSFRGELLNDMLAAGLSKGACEMSLHQPERRATY
jgi:hypothetical protein